MLKISKKKGFESSYKWMWVHACIVWKVRGERLMKISRNSFMRWVDVRDPWESKNLKHINKGKDPIHGSWKWNDEKDASTVSIRNKKRQW